MLALGHQRQDYHQLTDADRTTLFLKEKTNVLRRNGVLLAGPGSDGITVTWKDNFDSFYSEVAELGRYAVKPKASSTKERSLIIQDQ